MRAVGLNATARGVSARTRSVPGQPVAISLQWEDELAMDIVKQRRALFADLQLNVWMLLRLTRTYSGQAHTDGAT